MKEIKNSALTKFLKSTKAHFFYVDQIMKFPAGRERDEKLAHEMNRFNFDFDSFAHFECGVPLKKLQSILNKSFKV